MSLEELEELDHLSELETEIENEFFYLWWLSANPKPSFSY